MEKKSKKTIIIGVTSLLLVTLILIGLTYAYYRTRIIGNDADTSISVTSKKMEVTYSDGNSSIDIGSKIEPGDSFTKEFTITNTGDDTGYFSINLENIVNTFIYKDDLTYTLTKNGSEISSGTCPGTDKPIYFKDSLEAAQNGVCTDDNGCLANYKLTITYINANYDQSEDMGSTLEGLIQIRDGIDVIEISSVEQMKALSRVNTYNEIQSKTTTIVNEVATILNVDLSNIIDLTDKVEYFQTASYSLTTDLTLEYNTTFGDDYFFNIGSFKYPFKGDFYGNDHTITLSGNISSWNAWQRGFGLFNYLQDAFVSDLNITTANDIIISSLVNPTSTSNHMHMGLLSGYATNSTIDNIDIELNGYDYIVDLDEVGENGANVQLGLVSGHLYDTNHISNININIQDSNISVLNPDSTRTAYYNAVGLAVGKLEYSTSVFNTDLEEVRSTINNIKIDFNSSNVELVTSKDIEGDIGGVIGYSKLCRLENIIVNSNNSTIKVSADDAGNLNSFGAINAGGIVGNSTNGSNNTTNLGRKGTIISNVKFISKNDSNIEVISAKENLGGSVTVGGIVGLAYNNGVIENSLVEITNGTIIGERTQENETAATLGVHVGGINGRFEHTGMITNTTLNTNNVNIIGRATEEDNFVGGLVGLAFAPLHVDVTPLLNNKVNGNGTTLVKLEILDGNNDNTQSWVGALAGSADYVIEGNEVNNLNVEIKGLVDTNYRYEIGISNYIGRYTSTLSSSEFTPRTGEIINSKIKNVTLNTNGLDNNITITNY